MLKKLEPYLSFFAKKKPEPYSSAMDSSTSHSTQVLETRVLSPILITNLLTGATHYNECTTNGTRVLWTQVPLNKNPLISFQLFSVSMGPVFSLALSKSMWRVRMPEWKQKLYCWVTIYKSQCQCLHPRSTCCPFNLWVLPAVIST